MTHLCLVAIRNKDFSAHLVPFPIHFQFLECNMVRILSSFLFIFFCKASFAQQVTCPPDLSVACYEMEFGKPELTNAEDFKLVKEVEYRTQLCDTSQIIIVYKLVDASTEIVSSCSQIISILPFDQRINFPNDTVYYDTHLSEIPTEDIYNELNYPEILDACQVEITYEDLPVQFYPKIILHRYWKVYDRCADKLFESRQKIELRNLPNNSIQMPTTDCANNPVLIDSFLIQINGNPQEYLSCFKPFDKLENLINCLIDDQDLDSNLVVELVLYYDNDPINQLSLSDMISIHRHILGLERLEDPCLLAAADANRDGKVNGIDIIELRKLYLGVYTSWPHLSVPFYYVNDQFQEKLTFKSNEFPLNDLKIKIPIVGSVHTK